MSNSMQNNKKHDPLTSLLFNDPISKDNLPVFGNVTVA